MKPEVDEILERLAVTLRDEVAPALDGSYAGGHAGAAAFMLSMAAQEFDKAVDMRIAQAERMKQIFVAAASELPDGGLKTRLIGAAALEAADYRISTLNQMLARRAEVLIDLHAHVEEVDADWARKIDAEIWRHLMAEAAERMPAIPDAAGG